MPKKELEDKGYEFRENLQQRRFETILEWTGWGSIATLIAIIVAMVLFSDLNLDYQTSAMILMTIYFWAVSWSIGKMIKDTPQVWKHYFYWWTVAIIIGSIVLALGVSIVTT